ncbi:MAG: o-succinylbenzoate synthase [Gemmatimonadetes bacterium]|nr:o-succinylbenzoate synthase [Gemmatimonadota bacterium]
MKIERAELYLVPLDLREPFETSLGRTSERLILLVALHGDGAVGWGECVAGASLKYFPETVDGAWRTLATSILPAVVGRQLASGPAVGEAVAALTGTADQPMARAAAEMAAWDLDAKLQGIPLWQALGGARRPVPTGIALGFQADQATLLDKVGGALAEGYLRIKLKIEPGRDLVPLRAVRERFPDAPLAVDANGAYTLDDLPTLRELDQLGLLMIEQPLAGPGLAEHARLQSELRTPLCLDESIASLDDARRALELGSGRVINLKPGRVGGLGPAVAIHDLCWERGVPLWCGGMLESGVGRAHNVALATLPGFTLPADLSPSARYWERDLVDPEWRMEAGALDPHPGPGIGVAPDLPRIEALSKRRHSTQ